MGLDMCLFAKKYMSSSLNDSQQDIETVLYGSGLSKFSEDISHVEVSTDCMYWRKANQIHGWFVDNVQNGVDDCGYYEVSPENLKKLSEICDRILENPKKAEEILPPRSGFFFGSSFVDDFYIDQIVYTSKRIKELLELKERDPFVTFVYHSSW